jgi:methylenetetrahydrofolate reductase (NADPH)
LEALHELDHPFTDIGVGGHPEGHPAVPNEVLFRALELKAPLAHITTQICFHAATIVAWARELTRRGIDLPIRVDLILDRTRLLQKVVGESSPGEIVKQLVEIDEAEKAFTAVRGTTS